MLLFQVRHQVDGAAPMTTLTHYSSGLRSKKSGQVNEDGEMTAYEAQVLIGTSISGCNMSPDRVFDLKAAWSRLHSMCLIDRTDGLAIATPEGVRRISEMLGKLDRR